jgi:uncharacterized protein
VNQTIIKRRIDIIDALRGFSLAGIVIVHVVEQYVAAATPEGTMEAARQGVADHIVDAFIMIILRGKFFALFSFLFGLSFFIQMDNASSRGESYGGRFIWRAVILFVIGYLHHMFYRGDILTIYAILAIFLVPFFKLSNKWAYGVIAIIFLGLVRIGVFYTIGHEPLLTDMKMEPSDPLLMEYWNLLKEGSLAQVMVANATEGMLMKTDFQIGIFYRGYLTFAFFLIGMLIGKSRYFEHFRDRIKTTKNVLWISIGAFLALFILTGFLFQSLGPEVTFDSLISIAALQAFDLANVALTFVIIALFVLSYKTVRGYKWLSVFSPYGRMALTNYFMQSIIGTFILYGWGLGYIGQWRNIHLFGIAIAMIVLQVLFSKWWLGRFRYGPLEGLWRSATRMEWQPFKK